MGICVLSVISLEQYQFFYNFDQNLVDFNAILNELKVGMAVNCGIMCVVSFPPFILHFIQYNVPYKFIIQFFSIFGLVGGSANGLLLARKKQQIQPSTEKEITDYLSGFTVAETTMENQKLASWAR